MHYITRKLRTLSLLSAAALLLVGLSGCGDDNGTGSGGGGGGGGSGLICADGEAWVVCEEVGCAAGIIKSNGEMLFAEKDDDGKWYVDEYNSGTCAISGNKFTVTYAYGERTATFAYSISGKTLTEMTEDGRPIRTSTKKSGIYFTYRSGGGQDTLELCDGSVPDVSLVGPNTVTITTEDIAAFRYWMHLTGGSWLDIITWDWQVHEYVDAKEPRLTRDGVVEIPYEYNKVPEPGNYVIVYRIENPECNGRVPASEVSRVLIVEQ